MLRFAGAVLAMSGFLVLADVAATLLWQEPVSAFLASRSQDTLERRLNAETQRYSRSVKARTAARPDPRRALARAARSFRARLDKGDAFGRVAMPTLGQSYVVAQGTDTATSNQTAVVQQGTTRSVPVSSVPADERLIVSAIRFTPNPVTSRNQVITATVTIKDTRGLLIRDARVFMRATPRVTTGDLKVTGDDGVATMQLTPNQNMRIRTGFNVQFFIKAFREGDPVLAGVAGYRLVQVRTSNA